MTSYAEYNREVSPLSEPEEEELASELMEVGSEAELDHFLGGLFHTISNVGKGVGKFLRSPAGHALGGILKQVASASDCRWRAWLCHRARHRHRDRLQARLAGERPVRDGDRGHA